MENRYAPLVHLSGTASTVILVFLEPLAHGEMFM
jgi:hypothetical protein